MNEHLMLLDTASLYFRAFYGVPDTFRAADGTPVNAVRGLLDFIARLRRQFAPDRIVACWDEDWRPAWRVDLVPAYKAHRVADAATGGEDVPDLLAAQVPLIVEALTAAGIPPVGAAGFEADDIIGTLVAGHRAAAAAIDVVTGDRDLFQLVGDDGVRVVYTARSVARPDLVDNAYLLAKYGVTGAQYAGFATLRGDASDGLPGVPGIGEKTAAALIGQFGSLPAVLAAADDPDSPLKPRLRTILLTHREAAQRAARVVEVRTDCPVVLPRAVPLPADRLRDLELRLGLGGALRRAAAVA